MRSHANRLTIAAVTLGTTFASLAAAQDPEITIDRSAPIISRHDIDINAPAEIVWKIQTDINSWPQWRPKVTSASLSDEIKPGASFNWEDSGLKIVSTIRDVVLNRRIAWTGPAQGIFAVHVWKITPTANGVHVHTEESLNGEGLATQANLYQPLLDQSLTDWLKLLKERSEKSFSGRAGSTQ